VKVSGTLQWENRPPETHLLLIKSKRLIGPGTVEQPSAVLFPARTTAGASTRSLALLLLGDPKLSKIQTPLVLTVTPLNCVRRHPSAPSHPVLGWSLYICQMLLVLTQPLPPWGHPTTPS